MITLYELDTPYCVGQKSLGVLAQAQPWVKQPARNSAFTVPHRFYIELEMFYAHLTNANKAKRNAKLVSIGHVCKTNDFEASVEHAQTSD